MKPNVIILKIANSICEHFPEARVHKSFVEENLTEVSTSEVCEGRTVEFFAYFSLRSNVPIKALPEFSYFTFKEIIKMSIERPLVLPNRFFTFRQEFKFPHLAGVSSFRFGS